MSFDTKQVPSDSGDGRGPSPQTGVGTKVSVTRVREWRTVFVETSTHRVGISLTLLFGEEQDFSTKESFVTLAKRVLNENFCRLLCQTSNI